MAPTQRQTVFRYLVLVAKRLVPADVRLAVRAILYLPPRVAWFYLRAHAIARRRHDEFSLVAPVRPKDLSQLIALARGRRHAVELGTGSAWTVAALALAERRLEIVSYDPVEHTHREDYLRLAGAGATARIHLRPAPAESGPDQHDPPVELLFIDIGGHSRSDTVATFRAWRDSLAPDAVVAFHDYTPLFPGVPMAVAQLGLAGRVAGESLFVWRAPEAGAVPRTPE
jgi:predicted O-methyltransferase YrrM